MGVQILEEQPVDQCFPNHASRNATMAYAAAAAAPPTSSVLNAPHKYPLTPLPAPVTLALTAPKTRSTKPVRMHE